MLRRATETIASGLATLAFVVLWTVAAAAAEDAEAPEQHGEYRDVVARAVAEFDAGHFAEARALFLRAHELWPSARTLRTLGMTSFELRIYPRALQELQAAVIDTRRPLSDDQRRELEALIERTRTFIGRYRVHLTPAEAELLVDGAPEPLTSGELVLTVGDHLLTARAAGYGELRRTLVVQGSEDEELSLLLEPVHTSPLASEPSVAVAPVVHGPPNRTPAVISLGVGAASLVASGVFIALSLSDKHSLEQHCPYRLCPSQFQRQEAEMKRFANFATVGLVAGAVGVAAGAYLWLAGEPERAPRVKPELGCGTAGVSYTF